MVSKARDDPVNALSLYCSHLWLQLCCLQAQKIKSKHVSFTGRGDGGGEGRKQSVFLGSLAATGRGHVSWEMDRLSGNSMQLCTSRFRKTLPETRL